MVEYECMICGQVFNTVKELDDHNPGYFGKRTIEQE